jgi:hypothetical protein
MKYRKLDKDYDRVFGHRGEDFWTNVPDAVGQAVLTRLKLEVGQWFLDLEDGTPWQTRVLGKYTSDTRDPVIRFRTLGTQGAREIVSYSSNLDRETRAFTVDVILDTIYGLAELRNLVV